MLNCAGASGRNWIEGSGTLPDSPHQYQHLEETSRCVILVIGNKVASFTNLHQCLQEHSICISYMALKGINTPSLYIDQTQTENKTEEKHTHKNKINYSIIIIHFYPEQSNN